MQTVAIVDYNMGNLHSVRRAVEHTAPDNFRTLITADPGEIRHADRVVFPGQGAARDCMRELHALELAEVINEVVQTRPFLGICMGMQVLMDASQENDGVECLGIYPGKVHYFAEVDNDVQDQLKIPQMGWNQIWQKSDHPLWQGINDGARFYFVHSYYVEPEDNTIITGATDYGVSYAAAIARDNVFAIQAHPEKSADDGLRLLSNFMQWSP